MAVPDVLECLADLARDADNYRSARLFGAETFRQRNGTLRFKVYDAGYAASVAELRDA